MMGLGQWRVRNKMLLILWLIFLISYLDRVNFSVALPAISAELGLTAGKRGWCSALSSSVTGFCKSSLA